MKKRIIAIFMGFMMMSVALSGCANEKEQETTSSVTNDVNEVESEDASNTENLEVEESKEEEPVTEEEESVAEEQVFDEQEEFNYRVVDTYEVPESIAESSYDLEAALTCVPLKEAFAPYFRVGMAMTGYNADTLAVNSPEMRELLKYHCNTTTMTNLMKPSNMLVQSMCQENARGGVEDPVIDFTTTDKVLEFCQANEIGLRGHTLVWHTQTPDWFFREGYTADGAYVSADTMKYRLESYIRQMMQHCQDNYPGVVYCWDVVNECVEISDGETESGWFCRMSGESPEGTNQWYDILGYEYVELAFTYARKYADDDVVLVYNDYNTQDKSKRLAICKLIRYLTEKDLVDALGMQCNLSVDTNLSDVYYSIVDYAKLGVELQCTELSIKTDSTSQEDYEKQAEAYEDFMRYIMLLDDDNGGPANITVVNVFSLMDGYLFYDNDTTNYCLFDCNIQPKPCYYSFIDTVREFGKYNTDILK